MVCELTAHEKEVLADIVRYRAEVFREPTEEERKQIEIDYPIKND